MRLIVAEEELQLEEVRVDLEISAKLLEPHKDDPDFGKNSFIKKEIGKIQKNIKYTKQETFKQNLADWESGDIFYPPKQLRSRSQSRNFRQRQRSQKTRS